MKFIFAARSEFMYVLKRSFAIFVELLKILIPVTIVVKILNELGLVSVIGKWVMPLMSLVGLPGEMGLVWATGLVSSPYAAIIAYTEISKTIPLSIAQVTILSAMVLIAHNMIIEVTIGKKIGVSIWFQIVLRILSAFAFGALLNFAYQYSSHFDSPAFSMWVNESGSTTFFDWLISILQNYLMMFVFTIILIAILRFLEKMHLLEWLYNVTEPLLNFFGMSKKAAPIAIIGMTLGLSVGGGLIINEAKNGNLTKKDVFLVLSLMCLLHSVIEDTIVMTTIGADLSGILLARLIFTFAVFYLISHSKFIQRTFLKET